MPPLPIISGRELIKALAKLGYVQARRKGSHIRLNCPGRNPVTVPDHDPLDRGTLREILRIVKLSVEELMELLR